MKKLNIKEAKALIKKYRSITIEDILKAMENTYLSAPRALTGFGSESTCTLCQPVPNGCKGCIYSNSSYPVPCVSDKTYDAIDDADTPIKLKNAFRKRATYIESVLNKLEV